MSNNEAMAALAGMGIGLILVLIAIGVFTIICMWKIFVKAGEPGWKCLIPIYGQYVFYKIAWEPMWFFITLGLSVLTNIITGIGASNSNGGVTGFGLFLMIVVAIAAVIIGIVTMVKLAKRFGKSGGFAAGLIFLEPIFMAILAFDSSDYDRSRA